jgi:hypothetical protein
VRGRSSEALPVLNFIVSISLISTLLAPILSCGESVISDSLCFFIFVMLEAMHRSKRCCGLDVHTVSFA